MSAFDGIRHHLGLSCAFEIPSAILSFVFEDKLDLSQVDVHSLSLNLHTFLLNLDRTCVHCVGITRLRLFHAMCVGL